jgi:hypothetical protein
VRGRAHVRFAKAENLTTRTLPLRVAAWNRGETPRAALGGIKSLYSESYFDREAFDRIYGGDAYSALKAKYDAGGAFPHLYDKR